MKRHILRSKAACLLLALCTLLAASQVSAAADGAVHVRGRVIDSAGKSVAGATIFAVGSPWDFDRPLSQARSGEDGRFQIEFKKSLFSGESVNHWKYAAVAAVAPGFVPAWDRWDQVDAAGELVLQLSGEDVPIEGRILDLEGRPVIGASVKLTDVSYQATPLKDLGIDGYPEMQPQRPTPPFLPGFVVTGDRPITTDGQGRFRIAGIGKDRTVAMQVFGQGLARSYVEVVTRRQEVESRRFQNNIEMRRTIYGATFDFTIEPGRVVTGTVRDAQTQQPLAGVTVRPSQWSRELQCVTDSQGHYRIEGMNRKGDGRIAAVPNAQQCYFIRTQTAADQDSAAPMTLDFELHRGVWISGKVANAATGAPVEGALVQYVPYLSNSFVEKLPEFHYPLKTSHSIPAETAYYSKADGSYRLVGAPGAAIVQAYGSTQPFRSGIGFQQINGPKSPDGRRLLTYDPQPNRQFASAMKAVNIAENATDTRVDFELDPGITIHLQLVDNAGQPVAGAAVLGHSPGHGREQQAASSFDAVAFRPDESRTLWFWDMPRKIGKTIKISPADVPSRELTVMLEPMATVSGRLIGLDGLPIANARIQTEMELLRNGTDTEGKFNLMLLPGGTYHLSGIKASNGFDTDVDKLAIKPGESKEIGDVHYKEYR